MIRLILLTLMLVAIPGGMLAQNGRTSNQLSSRAGGLQAFHNNLRIAEVDRQVGVLRPQFQFPETDGWNPVAALIGNPTTVLFGTTNDGGYSQLGGGTSFRLVPNASGFRESVIWRFQADDPNGTAVLDRKIQRPLFRQIVMARKASPKGFPLVMIAGNHHQRNGKFGEEFTRRRIFVW